jgi:hypothetical protein
MACLEDHDYVYAATRSTVRAAVTRRDGEYWAQPFAWCGCPTEPAIHVCSITAPEENVAAYVRGAFSVTHIEF